MAKFPFFGPTEAEPVGVSSSRPWRWSASVDTLVLLSSLFWAVAGNSLFFTTALQGRSWEHPASWAWALALGVMVVGLHVLLLAPLANRWTVKPLLSLLIVTSALATYYMQRYGVYFDPSMVRNVLATDLSESRELLTPSLLPHLLGYAVLPLALLWRVDISPVPLPRAVFRRLAVMAVAAAATVVAVVAVYQPLASLMRNHKEVRYLITPANYLWSAAAVGLAQAKGAAAPRQAIGLDAQAGPSWRAQAKPRLLVLVVGETARAANWGLNGYARQTTPELAQLPVVNFSQVGSCGTNTEVSVPCMFAPVGRRDYDEARIQGSESLLHVLARAGVDVHWRDNQSGCKGVCDELPMDYVEKLPAAADLCSQGRCLDEGLLIDLDQRLAQARGTQILVLHQLGNHGPSYFRRYPEAFRRFVPDCRNDDLQRCSPEEIVNAYDNALLYTDHVLSRLIRQLDAKADQVDSAVYYVSDHGESLGENNFFLHGLPYAIAPAVQKQVPMVMWFSAGFMRQAGLDLNCLRERARAPASHDHLFHSVLSLLDVKTALHARDWDLIGPCQTQHQP